MLRHDGAQLTGTMVACGRQAPTRTFGKRLLRRKNPSTRTSFGAEGGEEGGRRWKRIERGPSSQIQGRETGPEGRLDRGGRGVISGSAKGDPPKNRGRGGDDGKIGGKFALHSKGGSQIDRERALLKMNEDQ
jgi:hypothetical protein